MTWAEGQPLPGETPVYLVEVNGDKGTEWVAGTAGGVLGLLAFLDMRHAEAAQQHYGGRVIRQTLADALSAAVSMQLRLILMLHNGKHIVSHDILAPPTA